MSKKTATTKKAAPPKKKVVARKAAPPKKKVVATKAAPLKKQAAPPKKKVVATKAAPPKKKAAPPKKAARKPAPPKPKKQAVEKAAPPPPPKVVARKAAPAPKAAPPPAAPNPLRAHAWKDVSLSLDGELHKVIFFDWGTLSDAKRDPSPTAKYQPNRNPFAWVEEFDEYVVGHWCDPVNEGAWEPVAVVGVGHASTTESFAEPSNRGFLAIVRDGGSFPAGTVLWLDGPSSENDEPFVVAADVTALQIIRR